MPLDSGHAVGQRQPDGPAAWRLPPVRRRLACGMLRHRLPGQADVGDGDGPLEQCGQLAALLFGKAGAEVPPDRLPVHRPGAPQRVAAGR